MAAIFQNRGFFITPKKKFFLFFLFLLFMLFIIRFKSFYVVVGRDVCGIAYTGEMVMQGRVPYRDIWDHKTPLIFYLNALLFKLFGTSFLILSFFEVIFLWLGCILFYKLTKMFFDKKISLWLCFLFAIYMGSLYIAESFGMTETYATLTAVAAIYLVTKYKATLNKLYLFFSGFMISITFLFRQTGAIVLFPILIYLVVSRGLSERQKIFIIIREYSIMFTGLFIPLFIFWLYFLSQHALKDSFSQIFTYNFIYSKDNTPIYKKFFILVKEIYKSNLRVFPFLLSFSITGALYKFHNFLRYGIKNLHYELLQSYSAYIMFVALVFFDFFSISLTNRYYGHYFVQVIPGLTLLCGYTLEYFFKFIKSIVKITIFIIVLFSFSSPLVSDIYESFAFFKVKESLLNKSGINIAGHRYLLRYNSLINWILRNTIKDDYIYIWGIESGLYFITKRKCPSRYNSLAGLQTPGYVKRCDLEEFINNLDLHKPLYIINMKYYTCDSFMLNLEGSEIRIAAKKLANFINTNYAYETTIEGCDIYKKIKNTRN